MASPLCWAQPGSRTQAETQTGADTQTRAPPGAASTSPPRSPAPESPSPPRAGDRGVCPVLQRARLLLNPRAVTPGDVSTWAFQHPSPPPERAFPRSSPEPTRAAIRGLVNPKYKPSYEPSSPTSRGQGRPRVTERFNADSVAAAPTPGEGSTELPARPCSPAGAEDALPWQPAWMREQPARMQE